ncbi:MULTISPECIES: hypothetical protein [unclassified Streptomyces]|uniref:hypothetical protein n=1 Tax=unclassified Streptomyces TaxID=2593676 RepID=UPI0033AC9190
MANSLVARGVQVQQRTGFRDDEFLLCRMGSEPAWEVSLEGLGSPTLSELETADLLHIEKIPSDSIFLIAFRRASFGIIHDLLRGLSWCGAARYLKGDGEGISFSLTELGSAVSSPDDFGSG